MTRAVHAEWTKLRTSPGTMWLLLAVIAATVTVSIMAAAAIRCPTGDCGVDSTKISLTGIQLGQAVVAILAVMAIGNEYGTGMVRLSLTATPRRGMMLAAKASVLVGVVTAASTLAVLVSVVVGRHLLTGQGSPALSRSDGPALRAAIGSILYLALIAMLSLGIAAAVRHATTAIGVVLGLLYVFPIITQAVSDPDWQRHLQQIGPMSAGLAVQATAGLDGLPIGPWAGLGVLAAWAGAAMLIGGLLLRYRDA